jgi:hypothetical protein
MDGLNWHADISQDSSIPAIDWSALQRHAIHTRQSLGQNPITSNCHIPPFYNKGGLHLVRLLEFDDKTKWIARIQLHEWTPDSEKRLLHEIHTLSILKERTDVPVPVVFDYDASGKIIGRAFMLMEFIPGSTAMDAFGGWKVHHGEIPAEYKESFTQRIARIQVSYP